VVDAALHARIMRDVMQPTVDALAAEGVPYTGFLYAGLMIGGDGAPRVLEFNCRCGDPETQPLLFRMKSDLVELCLAAIDGELDAVDCEWDPRPALGVVLAAGGYPGSYRTGDVIRGLDAVVGQEDAKLFHAGTRAADGQVLTDGGRVLCAVALGETVAAAQRKAYQLAGHIDWDGIQYRRDIGWRAVAREAGGR
jgi:phosphoribosylamine--glycine ligase